MHLDTVGQLLNGFYRLVGTLPDDHALTELGEDEDQVAFEFLSSGVVEAQQWMLDCGYVGWRRRTGPLDWQGSDATDGGRYVEIPDDFLRAYGDETVSALTEPNGRRWGRQIHPREESRQGDYFYFRGDQLWLARNAKPPTPVVLDYHYAHPEIRPGVEIDFPVRARRLIVTEAAYASMFESWLPGDRNMEMKIAAARDRAREEARKLARQTKQPRQFRRPPRYGNRW